MNRHTNAADCDPVALKGEDLSLEGKETFREVTADCRARTARLPGEHPWVIAPC